MSTVLHHLKIAYFSVPKVACTTIKTFFFEVENNNQRTFEGFLVNEQWVSIHSFYASKRFDEWDHAAVADYLKLAVVRDPVDRFLSAYRNRVMFHNELDKLRLTPEDVQSGVVARPDLDQYIAHFHRYRELARPIGSHTLPLVEHLGGDAAYFDHVFNIRDLASFVEVVRSRAPFAPDMGHYQTGGPEIKPDVLSAAQRKFIMDLYAEDYRVFGKYL